MYFLLSKNGYYSLSFERLVPEVDSYLGLREQSGSVVDCLRLRGPGFEPYLRHCVVALSKTHLSLLSTGSTQEDPCQHN